ncbi:MAG: DUF5320 domain-containing protein [Methanobacteriota archaeon]
MTGRNRGYCAGYPAPGYASGPARGRGRGMGFGMGRGFGRGRGFGMGFGPRRFGPAQPMHVYDEPYVPYRGPTKEEEKAYLEDAVKALENDLNGVKDRLKELQKEDK